MHKLNPGDLGYNGPGDDRWTRDRAAAWIRVMAYERKAERSVAAALLRAAEELESRRTLEAMLAEVRPAAPKPPGVLDRLLTWLIAKALGLVG